MNEYIYVVLAEISVAANVVEVVFEVDDHEAIALPGDRRISVDSRGGKGVSARISN